LTPALGFIHGMGLREMPCFKGFGGWSSLFDELLKYIFTYSQIIIGNIPSVI
jgi:hypothetical protein